MINWFNIPDEGLSNGGLFEVKELEVTENGTYETKGEMYNKVTVNVEGGGGSSDFSTAEVAIVNNDEVTRDFYLPIIDNINEPHASFGIIQVQQGGNTNVTAILYENLCGCSILGGGTVTVTGNATVTSPTMVAISGDCTITIS